MIVLETTVLSHAWRRAKRDEAIVATLASLIVSRRTLGVPGIVIQELLSSTRSKEQRGRLEGETRSFRVLLADRDLHVQAADIATICTQHGIAAASVDCLIAAHALRANAELFTLDEDFVHIAKHTGLRLYDG